MSARRPSAGRARKAERELPPRIAAMVGVLPEIDPELASAIQSYRAERLTTADLVAAVVSAKARASGSSP